MGVCLAPVALLRGEGQNPPIRYASLVGFGLLWASVHGHWGLSERLPTALEGVDLEVSATVISIPQANPHVTRFLADVTPIRAHPGWQGSKRVRLSWYAGRPRLSPGDIWTVVVRLRRPNGMLNPGGFDYEGWLFAHRIDAVGYVRRSLQRNARSTAVIPRLNAWRARVGDELAGALKGRPFQGIVSALGLGIKGGLSRHQWAVLRRTGTAHLMAISGLHIGLAAGAGLIFGSFCGRWTGAAARGLPAPVVGIAGAVSAAAAYGAMAGFALPTVRALLMVCIAGLGILLRRRLSPSVIFALVVLVVIATDPFSVLMAGFWLSFAAVAVLLYSMSGRVRPAMVSGASARAGGWLWRWVTPQVVIAVGLAPLGLLIFGGVPGVGIAANVVAIPWVSLVVVPLTLLGTMAVQVVPALGVALLRLAESAVAALWPFLELLAELGPQLEAPGALVGASAGLLAALGVVIVLAPRGVPGRWLGLVVLSPLAFAAPERPASGAVWVSILDVGQGLATVVETRTHVLLYDTGARFGEFYDIGESVILPFLNARGWTALDTVVLSHADGDHIGGFRSVAAGIPIREVKTNARENIARDLAATPASLDTPVVTLFARRRSVSADARLSSCLDGDRWTWDGVRFEVLHPQDPGDWSRNDGSCVLRISSHGGQLLLTGDVESRAERTLFERHPDRLKSDVLIVPHHGSNTSSTAEFLRHVQPRFAVVSAGYRNRWGMPTPPVVTRLEGSGAALVRTDRAGAVQFQVGPGAGQIVMRQHRQHARRYWHRGAEP